MSHYVFLFLVTNDVHNEKSSILGLDCDPPFSLKWRGVCGNLLVGIDLSYLRSYNGLDLKR